MASNDDVLRLIEQAREENRTELDLSGREIETLPEQIGELTSLTYLDLSENNLNTLPEGIGNLTSLTRLRLLFNALTTLPESIGNLIRLTELDLMDNKLTTLPESIGNLIRLTELDLWHNKLTTLPESIGNLTNLTRLDLATNSLSKFPENIVTLTGLTLLTLRNNRLSTLPESISNLTSLTSLNLMNNQLTDIPASLVQLEELRELILGNNPLNPALQSAYESGLDEVMAYLRSLDDAESLYEAKLVLVGEGDVGKTTLLKAMSGREPREKEPTTHGVNIDIQSLRLPHPEKDDTEIRLNAWDFGGQEIYRVTHQFFFSRRSIYLLVWEPRAGVQQCQVEDWLRMIHLRVGEGARVIIVSTHCKTGERIARIDKPVFQRDFGDMIVGFHEVDSLVDDPETGEKTGIAKLKAMIAEAAKDLEQMGMLFNRDWRAARDELLGMEAPRIGFEEFTAVCDKHGLDDISTKTLADLMHDLGYIVYYSDDENLKNDVVLQPEWLTKAIGFVLEDRTTQELEGILPDDRLTDVWKHHPLKNEPRYEEHLYPFFLRLMEKYDVSYRLESGDASLIAQHVPQVRPDLPWLPEEDTASGLRRIAMVCVMDENPTGLVPWMTVRTHDYAYKRKDPDGQIHRLHWERGMFLRNGNHGEAMLELRGREFHIYAEALWPEYFMNLLQRTLDKLIKDNWAGMKDRYAFTVPCKGLKDGNACNGRFDIEALREFLEEGDDTIRCQTCRDRQNIVDMLFGFADEDVSTQLAHIDARLEGLESRLANYVWGIMNAMASESKDGPRLFTVEPAGGGITSKRYQLQLWCEAEDCQHPVLEDGKGIYEFDTSREWFRKAAPYANFIAGVLRTIAPMVAPAVNAYFGDKTIDDSGLKHHLDLAKEATGKLLQGELEVSDPTRIREGVLSEAERSGVLALHSLLREEDPHHERLGLKRVPTYTGDFRWLCERHYEDFQPKIPDEIKPAGSE